MTIPAHPRQCPPRPVFIAECTACEAVRIVPEQALPDGWTVEQVGEIFYAFCPDCSADVPAGRRQ